MRRGLHRYSVGPERPDWHRVDGGWRYTTSADVARPMREHRIDDAASREWMQKGAPVELGRPTLNVRWPPG